MQNTNKENMKTILRNYIQSGTCLYDDAVERINLFVANGTITAEEAEELFGIASTCPKEALPTTGEIQTEITALKAQVHMVEGALLEFVGMMLS